MNKIVCAVATVACATLSFAAPFDDEGGLLVKKGSYLGKIAFVLLRSICARADTVSEIVKR